MLGPEGIGKTRLLAELAHEVQDGGAIVLYGRCDHAHRGPRALLDETLRSGGSSLAELDGAEVPLTDLAGAVARFLPTWAAHRPVLIALDDLHLADSDTLEVVADLASWSGADAMLVVAAFRTDAAGARSPAPSRATRRPRSRSAVSTATPWPNCVPSTTATVGRRPTSAGSTN